MIAAKELCSSVVTATSVNTMQPTDTRYSAITMVAAGRKANRQEFLNSKDRKYNDDKNKDFNDMDRIALKPCIM